MPRIAQAGYKRTKKIPEFPDGWKSYRTALLEKILAKHGADVKEMPHISAYDFPDIADVYTRDVYEQEYPSSFVTV